MTTSMTADNSSYFTAAVDDVVLVCRPQGYPPWAGDTPSSAVKNDYEVYGFKILNPELGKFIDTDSVTGSSGCVKYLHEKSGKQIIQYTAAGAVNPDAAFFMIIQPVPVHDHASVYQGGPAFATYYAKTPQEE